VHFFKAIPKSQTIVWIVQGLLSLKILYLLCFVLFCFILFCSVLLCIFYSVLFHCFGDSSLFLWIQYSSDVLYLYSIQFNTVLFSSVLFCSLQLVFLCCSVPLSVLFYSFSISIYIFAVILCCSILFDFVSSVPL